jgi:hypothetical protein
LLNRLNEPIIHSSQQNAAIQGPKASGQEIEMSKQYEVSANDTICGVFTADSEQAARDLAAQDAGYKSEADMVAQLEQPSELVAADVTGTVVCEDKRIDMAAARNLMDDELCEAINGTVDTDQEFMDAYAKAHEQKYGTEFVFA